MARRIPASAAKTTYEVSRQWINGVFFKFAAKDRSFVS